MFSDVMNAVAHFSLRIGNVLRVQPLIDGFPSGATVVSAKRTSRGDRDKDPVSVVLIQDHCMETHAAGAWLPLRSRAVTAQSWKFVPGLTAVGRVKQGGVFNAGIDVVRIVE